MLASQLSTTLKPFRPLISRNALSLAYRSLELSATTVHGCATFAILEAAVKLPLKAPVYVDTQQWLAVVDSLPAEEEVQLKASDSVLEWSAGAASGKLALIAVEDMKAITYKFGKSGWPTSASFKKALDLGSIACANSQLTSVGMYGVVLDSRTDTKKRDSTLVMSSDNTTVAVCRHDPLPASAPDLITLPPDGVDLLTGIMNEKGTLDFDKDTLYYKDDTYRMLLRHISPLQNDIRKVYSNFVGGKNRITLPRDRVSAFVKRALGLMTVRQIVYVDLGVRNGKMTLSFEEASAASTEYYLVEKLKMPDVKDIKLNALKLARALSHCNDIVLDFLGRDVLVLEGKDPEFRYCVAGFGS